MPLTVTSLASGSSGNALLVRSHNAAILVDCGLSQRAIERALAHAGLRPTDLTALLLTHEHGDHAGCAGPFARRYGLPLLTNPATAMALDQVLAGVRLHLLATGAETELGAFQIRSFSIAHDAADPVGYVIRFGHYCVAIAIDMGSWEPNVAEALACADLIVVEANYDHERLRMAPYDWQVKQRIYGPRGHLDNIEAGRLLARIGADGRQRTAWLAHISQQANTPEIATRIVRGVLSMAEVRCIRVQALPRRAPMHWVSDALAQQLSIFDDP